MACIDPSGVATQLLSLMIAGDMPINLKVTRLCCGKLVSEAASATAGANATRLVQVMETLDSAVLFKAPKSCLTSLRSEALVKLSGIAPQTRN